MMRWQRAVGLAAVYAALATASACDPEPIEQRLAVQVQGAQPTVIDTVCSESGCRTSSVALALEYPEHFAEDERVVFEQYRVDYALEDAGKLPYYAARTSLTVAPGDMLVRDFVVAGDGQRAALPGGALRGPIAGSALLTLAGYAYDDAQVFVEVAFEVELRDVADERGGTGAAP